MAGIKRFITYIYAYENGTKGINAGFAKVESGEMNAGLKCICVEHQFGWEWIRYTFLK